jgi:Domain of unknown function (DUF4193)
VDVKDTMDEIIEEEEVDEAQDDLEPAEPSENDLADATVPPDPATGGDVESIQELLVKQEAASEEAEEDEEEVIVPLTREEKLAEPADARVVPMQATEFICRRCFLVKHRSQLADKKKLLCRDCG